MQSKQGVRTLVLIAVATAILVVGGPLAFPLGVIPITLQTLVVGLIASTMDWKITLPAIALYIVLGAMGLPVFAGAKSGVAVLVGPTAGYLWSFFLYAIIVGLLLKISTSIPMIILANLIGATVNLAVGAIYLGYVSHMSLTGAFAAGFTPFILGTLLKVAIVVAVAVPILKFNHGQLK